MFGDLFNWFWDVLSTLGLHKKKEAKIVFLGLDNAGKSTLLHMLKHGRMVAAAPTLYAAKEELAIGKITFNAYDLGGHETARRLWRDYCTGVDGIIFLVDAADRTRFEEAREEINALLAEPSLAEVPMAVLGNKIDIPIAASEDELRSKLGLPYHMTIGLEAKKGNSQARPVELFMVSIVKRMGYSEAFKWLSGFL